MKKILFENGKTIDGASTFNKMQDNVEDVFNGKESMGSIVVEDITCKNLSDIEDAKVNGSEEINRKIYNVKPNTEYTLSYTKSRISGVTITQATIWGIRKITFYDKNGTQLSTLSGTTISLPENSSKKCLLTFTTPANTSYVECRLDNNNGDSNVNTLVSNVQLEKGPVATDYVEHKEFANDFSNLLQCVYKKTVWGNALYSTGISVNAGAGGRTYLVCWSTHSTNGDSTWSNISMLRCVYSGNTLSITKIVESKGTGSSLYVSFSIDDNGILQYKNSHSGGASRVFIYQLT